MSIIGLALVCLIVGAIIFTLGRFLLRLLILVFSKLFDILNFGCGCLGLIVLGFIFLLAIGLLV